MGEIVGRVVGALVALDRDHARHERAAGHQGDVAERARAHLLLRGQPAAAEPLSVAGHDVDAGLLDRREDARRLFEIGRERLLDHHGKPALAAEHDRIDMKVLFGRDDDGRHFRAAHQLAIVLRDEIGADRLRDFLSALRDALGDPDPLDRRVLSGNGAAEIADAACADDRQANASCRLLHCPFLHASGTRSNRECARDYTRRGNARICAESSSRGSEAGSRSICAAVAAASAVARSIIASSRSRTPMRRRMAATSSRAGARALGIAGAEAVVGSAGGDSANVGCR
jgi:hypothetical protein